MENLKGTLIGILAILGFAAWFILSREMIEFGGDDVLFLYDSESDEFFAPPCIMQCCYNSKENILTFAESNNLLVITNKQSKSTEYSRKLNEDCRDYGKEGIMQVSTVWQDLMRSYGPDWLSTPSRWNDDGSWKW